MRIKKLMAIILAVMIFAGLFSTSAMAEEAPASLVDDFEWDGETGVNSPSFGTYDGITWNQDNWWPNMGLQRLLCNTDQTATCNGVVIDFNSVEDDAFVANNVTKHLWVHPNSGYVVNNSVGTVTYDLTSLGNTNSKTFDLMYAARVFSAFGERPDGTAANGTSSVRCILQVVQPKIR